MSKTNWIIIGVSGGICLLIGIFLIYPGLSRDWKTYRETKAAQKSLEELSQKKEVLGQLSKTTNLDEISRSAAGYIPEEAKSSDLILELSSIITDSGMSLDQITLESAAPTSAAAEDGTTSTTAVTQEKKDAKPAKVVGFSLKIKGSFDNLMRFFKAVETSGRLIIIDNLGVTQENDVLSASIQGEAYWNKANAQAEKSLANISVTAETLKKFSSLRQYSTPTDTNTEAGFGRTNPFSEVK